LTVLQRGHSEVDGRAIFQADRRERVRMRDIFFFGTAMVSSFRIRTVA
jgi:hypothetical protein